MAAVKVLARGFVVEIQTAATPTYTEILGLMSISISTTKTNADTTTFDDAGNKTHIPATIERSITCDGKFLEDQTTKARDPGQTAAEALAEAVGEDGLEVFRITTPAGTVKTFTGSCLISNIGGDNDNAADWRLEIRVSGAIVTT